MAEYDGLPLNTRTKVSEDALQEVWATRTANGGTVEIVAKPGSPAANQDQLLSKARQALDTNRTYLGHAPLPAGAALTTTQLTTAVRLLVAEVDSLARQNNALIRLALGRFEDVSDT